MKRIYRIHSRDSGCVWKDVLPEAVSPAMPPDRIFDRTDISICDWISRPEMIPASGILIMMDGVSMTEDSWTITDKGGWVYDASGLRDSRLYGTRGFFPPVMAGAIRYKGRALDLGSNWTKTNYGHWLRDSIGRLMVAESAGFSLDMFDHVILPIGNFPRSCPQVLKELGMEGRVLFSNNSNTIANQFEEVVRPFLPGDSHFTHPDLPRMISNRLNKSRSGPEKVYLSRDSRRCVSNQYEIENIARRRGFSIIDPRHVPFGSWANARVIIAPHQAGLVDMMICDPGAKVLELMSPSWQRPFYWSMAHASGHDYWVIIGSNGANGRDSMHADYSIPVKKVEEWISMIED